MRPAPFIALALLIAPSIVSAQFASSQQAWQIEMAGRCPSHHVEWVSDGSYDDLLAAYYQRLTPHLNREARRIADYSHRCASEIAGFSCEMAANIDAFQKLGLLDDFATWTCRNVTCEEAAICRLPLSPRK